MMGGHSDSEGMELELELAQEGEHKVIQHWIEVTELLAPRSSVHHATVMFAFEGVIDAITPEAATKLRGDLYGARVRVGLCASSHTSLHKLYDPSANYAEFVRGTWFQVFVDQATKCVAKQVGWTNRATFTSWKVTQLHAFGARETKETWPGDSICPLC